MRIITINLDRWKWTRGAVISELIETEFSPHVGESFKWKVQRQRDREVRTIAVRGDIDYSLIYSCSRVDDDDDVALATAGRSIRSIPCSNHMPGPSFMCCVIVDAEPSWLTRLFAWFPKTFRRSSRFFLFVLLSIPIFPNVWYRGGAAGKEAEDRPRRWLWIRQSEFSNPVRNRGFCLTDGVVQVSIFFFSVSLSRFREIGRISILAFDQNFFWRDIYIRIRHVDVYD